MLWHWISIDPHISSFSDIGGFKVKVCLNSVPIDTIFIIHVIDDITQSMTLFDAMARVSVKWTDFQIVETRGGKRSYIYSGRGGKASSLRASIKQRRASHPLFVSSRFALLE